jgi:hypothetical protein
MDVDEAKEKLAQYRDVLSKRHNEDLDKEYMSIEEAYKQLAKGTPLIDPFQAIRDNAWRADGRPILAMARADQKLCDFRNWGAPTEIEFRARKARWDRQRAANLTIKIRNCPVCPVERKSGVAMVPLVPAEAFNENRFSLPKCFILWEVENWDASPPVDPMLLKPIGGDLYAVIWQWDLTDIERMIIAGTRRDA